MNTDALIDLLARGAGPAPRAVAARRLVPAVLAGMLASTVLALLLIGPVPAALFATPVPWVKLGYAMALLGAAGWLAARLARPLPRWRTAARCTAAVLAAMAALGLLAWWTAPQADRMPLLLGESWAACPWNVLALSLPALTATLWAVRGLAPADTRAAGAACGLVAGAAGAFGYAFACPEPGVSFVAAWYTLGVLLTAGAGALLGPRLLRW
jgi:hypothetical protein